MQPMVGSQRERSGARKARLGDGVGTTTGFRKSTKNRSGRGREEIIAARELGYALESAIELGIIFCKNAVDLFEQTNAILDRLNPQPDSLDWFRSIANCHWIAPATLRLAQLAWPDGEWMLLIGDMQSCVVDPAAGKVVDLLWREEDVHPVAHAQVKSPWPSYEAWDAAERTTHCLPPEVAAPPEPELLSSSACSPPAPGHVFDLLRPDIEKLWMEKTLELAERP